jgi:hypothetical protein
VKYADGHIKQAFPTARGTVNEEGDHRALDWAVLASDTGNATPIPLSPAFEPSSHSFCTIYTAKSDNRLALPCFHKGEVRDVSGEGEDVIQIEAPIQPGDSGAPIVGEDGKVVGIVTAYLADSDPIIGFGTELKYFADKIK